MKHFEFEFECALRLDYILWEFILDYTESKEKRNIINLKWIITLVGPCANQRHLMKKLVSTRLNFQSNEY